MPRRNANAAALLRKEGGSSAPHRWSGLTPTSTDRDRLALVEYANRPDRGAARVLGDERPVRNSVTAPPAARGVR